MPTRKQYITQIWVYMERRNKLKRTDPRKITLYRKIRTWRKAIKRIDKRDEAINELVKKVNDYFNVNLYNKNGGKELILARNCYYKYGMENGIVGKYLSVMIKRPKYSCCRARLIFTRSFKKNELNKKQYHP